ncbi:hypothetical protein ABGB12_15230 [Actinocorallia sp. B10E7]|uniref:hypothetical protein n=1 Tax=Actinocorallia sp. B10E7 TaxID=3153558 RepID=UPI00325D0FE7
MLRKIAVSAASAGALTLLLGSPASASGNFHPSPLPTNTAWTVSTTGAVSATSSSITFSTPSVTANCTSGTATGNIPNASGGQHDPVATLAVATSGCTGAGLSFTLTPNTSKGAWELYATAPTAGGITPGAITGVSVKGTALGGACTVQADGPGGANSQTGQIEGSYDNSTGIIHATGSSNIKIKSVSWGCFGVISVGQSASLSGDFTISGTAPVINAT